LVSRSENRPSNHDVAREIATLIVTGVWREGRTLPREVELASQFGVGRPLIREALSILKAKGLIAARQRVGTQVRARTSWNMLDADLLSWTWAQRPTEDFVRQLLQIRRIMEPEACALCAERATDGDLARIERAYREMDAAGANRGAFNEPDLRFHRGILLGTGNVFLIALSSTIDAALRLSFEMSTLNAGAPRKSLPYHRAVLDEIWAHNPDGARAAMSKLIDLTERNILSALSGKVKAIGVTIEKTGEEMPSG
jgi:DNA-binding FadR family transcriptional regulator